MTQNLVKNQIKKKKKKKKVKTKQQNIYSTFDIFYLVVG